MVPFPELHTDRLWLRELVATDAESLFAIHGDASHMRWYGADPLATVADAENLIKVFAGWREHANPGTRWGIVRRSDNVLIGSCGLFKWNRNWHRCTVGYELTRSAQGQGYMREALTKALAYGFSGMALNRVDASVHPENGPSIKQLKSLGFVQEGRAREAGYWGGQRHDLLEFGLLRRDFAPVNVAS